MKKKLLIISVAAAVIGLLSACPMFNIIKKNESNAGLLFMYHENYSAQNVIGISPENDEIKVIYQLNDFSSYYTGLATDNGTIYVSDYCKGMTIHDGMLIIDNNGEQVDYLKTVVAPIGVTTAGDYLVIGGGNWYPPDYSCEYEIYNKNTLQKICGPIRELDILWGKTSVHEYKDGIIIVLGNHQAFTNGKIKYLSGLNMGVTDEWSIETYAYLKNHRSLWSGISGDSLILASEFQLTIAKIPLPLGSTPENVIDIKPLLDIPSTNLQNEQYWLLVYIDVIGNEFIGYVTLSSSNRIKLFKLNLDTGEIMIVKDMTYAWKEVPVRPVTLTANNKLYTYSYDSEGYIEEAVKVFSLDDFSFIRRVDFNGTAARTLNIQ